MLVNNLSFIFMELREACCLNQFLNTKLLWNAEYVNAHDLGCFALGIRIRIFILLVGRFRRCYVVSVMDCFDLEIIIEKWIELVLP